MTPRIACIGGWDPRGLAGLAVDLRFAEALGVHAFGAITVVTAQTERETVLELVSAEMLGRQLDAAGALGPAAIKIGTLGCGAAIAVVERWLDRQRGFVVLDPVMTSSAGATLLPFDALDHLRSLLARVDLVTPNIDEAERLCGWDRGSVIDADGLERAAQRLLALGARAVLVKGGHGRGSLSQDLYAKGATRAWLSSERAEGARGTGCALATAIAAATAWGPPRVYEPLDAVVVAKACVTHALRNARPLGTMDATRGLGCACWPVAADDMPWVTSTAQAGVERPSFAPLDEIGFYPIVERADDVARLARAGVRTVQLRIKSATPDILRAEVARAVASTRGTSCQLFINDHVELAVELGAFGVHLGQEDLAEMGPARVAALARGGVRLGVSTHCYAELARAIALHPSYVALGPIYPTKLKAMRFEPQGPERLAEWRRLCRAPLVAIGGLTLERIETVRLADGVSVVADLKVGSLEARARMFLDALPARRSSGAAV